MSVEAVSLLMFATTFLISYIMLYRQKFIASITGSSKGQRPPRVLPPAVRSFPIIGSLWKLSSVERMYVWFLDNKKKYGGVVAFYAGSSYSVVLQSREAINEALLKKSVDFASRPANYANNLFNPGQHGILNKPYNEGFRKYHQLVLKVLKEFGFGTTRLMENRINIESAELIRELKERSGQAFDPKFAVTRSVANVIASILFGRRFDSSDKTLDDMVATVHRIVDDFRFAVAVNIFPLMKFVPYVRRHISAACDAHGRLLQLLDAQIAASKGEEELVSLVGRFCEIEGPNYDRQELLYIARDLMLAGMETSSSTLRWLLAAAANHPELQQRLHDEIDSVIAGDRLPSLDDRANLPFVEAFILETMRCRTLIPTIAHTTIRDTEVCGFHIPANTIVLPNMYAIHMDPDVWTEPSIFNPGRFLDDEGRVIGSERIIPFSLGKRSCLGAILARQEIFLFLAAILQHFDIRPPEGQECVECTGVGIPNAPTNFDIRLVFRNKELA